MHGDAKDFGDDFPRIDGWLSLAHVAFAFEVAGLIVGSLGGLDPRALLPGLIVLDAVGRAILSRRSLLNWRTWRWIPSFGRVLLALSVSPMVYVIGFYRPPVDGDGMQWVGPIFMLLIAPFAGLILAVDDRIQKRRRHR